MNDSPMLLGTVLGQAYGAHPGAWRMPHAGPDDYVDVRPDVHAAQTAERGGMDYVFYPDRVFLWGDVETGPPVVSIEPLMTLAAVAHATRRIGLVPSVSTSFNEPYGLARQLRALDVMSRGRAGWNAIPSYEPEAFANYGRPVPDRQEKYERLHEVIQVAQALWASWPPEAGTPDRVTGQFVDAAHLRPVNLRGRQVASRGPLQIPPSEQGQPVIFMPFASSAGLQAAALYANGIIAMPSTMEEAKSQRDTVRSAAQLAGRSPDEVKLLSFASFGLERTVQEAVDRRVLLEDSAGLDRRLRHLSSILGVRIDPTDADRAFSTAEVAALGPGRSSPRGAQALALAEDGRTPREILGHGVLDQNPGLVGTAEQAADLMQEWMDVGATDGFTVVVDDLHDGMDLFVDQVVPILRRRGLRHDDYRGTTLRDHLGLPDQLGLDRRLTADQ